MVRGMIGVSRHEIVGLCDNLARYLQLIDTPSKTDEDRGRVAQLKEFIDSLKEPLQQKGPNLQISKSLLSEALEIAYDAHTRVLSLVKPGALKLNPEGLDRLSEGKSPELEPLEDVRPSDGWY